MEITSALICNFAEVREGILFVSGGGITRLNRPEYPAVLGVCIAIIMEGTEGELSGIPHEIEIVVQDADGQGIAELKGGFQAGDTLDVQPGELVQIPLSFNLMGVVIPGPSAYDIHVRLDGGERTGQPERMLTIRATQR